VIFKGIKIKNKKVEIENMNFKDGHKSLNLFY